MRKKIALSFVASLILSQSIYANDSKKLDTVIVTANKMEENLQEVPISMTVFNEFAIEDRKIESIQDVASYTSSFALIPKGSKSYTPSIRGFAGSVGDLPLSVIIDGIPISSAINASLMDIERIEVLKGPQGTLYGKEAQVGVINIITKKPSNETKAKLGVELSEDNKRQYTFSASGPIAEDKVFIGLSAKHYEKDGFIKNTLGEYTNNKEDDYGRIHLRYTPNDELEISLISDILQYDNGDIDFSDIPANKIKNVDQIGYDKTKINSHALKVSYDINDYLFESITTYRNVNADDMWVYPTMSITSKGDSDKYSQEFRLSNESNIFKWVAGVYADKSEASSKDKYLFRNFERISTSETQKDSFGAFIHTDYFINDKLTLTSGVRYDKVNQEFEDSTTKLDLFDNEVSPKISLKYQHNENSMYYATISKGYRSGGFHARAPEGYSPKYDSETLWNYEIGTKKTLFDNRLIVNSSIYYMAIDDMQVRIYPVVGVNTGLTDNAAQANSKGFELELQGKLSDTIDLFASYGYSDSIYDKYNDGRADYSGNKTTFAPEYNYNIGIQYRGDNGYFARADLNGVGKTYFDNANKYSKDPYRLVNAKIGYEADNYDIYLYGKNIFDEEYHSVGMYNGSGVLYSHPREIGIQLAYRF